MKNKVIIADDSKTIRMVIRKFLTTTNLIEVEDDNIYEAENGLELIALNAKHKDTTYIFADINMPILKGNEALEILIKTKRINANIIFVTTEDIENSMILKRSRFVLGLIKKPIKIEKLELEVARITKDIRKEATKEEIRKTKVQKDIISDLIQEYVEKSNSEDGVISKDSLSEIIDYYVWNNLVPDNEILPISQEVLKDYCKKHNLEVELDLKTFENIYENVRSLKEALFSKRNEIILREDIIDYILTADTLDVDTSVQDVLKDYLLPFMNILRGLGDLSDEAFIKYRTAYTDNQIDLLGMFLSDVVSFFRKLDSRIVNSHIDIVIKDLDILKDYRQSLDEIEKHPEELYKRLFLDYQPKYKAIKTLINNASKLDEGTEIIHKCTSLTNSFDNAHQAEFIKEAKESFVKINKTRVDTALIYFVYELERKLFRKLKNSKSVQNFYTKNNFEGGICKRTFLEYFIDKRYHNTELESQYKHLLKVLPIDKKRIIYLADTIDNKDDDSVKVLVNTINKYNPTASFNLFTKNSLLAVWLTNNEPDVVFLDYTYEKSQTVSTKAMFEKYPNIAQDVKIILVSDNKNDSVNREFLEMADTFIKKPFKEEKLKELLEFV